MYIVNCVPYHHIMFSNKTILTTTTTKPLCIILQEKEFSFQSNIYMIFSCNLVKVFSSRKNYFITEKKSMMYTDKISLGEKKSNRWNNFLTYCKLFCEWRKMPFKIWRIQIHIWYSIMMNFVELMVLFVWGQFQ